MLRVALEVLLLSVPLSSSRTWTSVLSLAPTICSFVSNRLSWPYSLAATCLLRMPKSFSELWEQMNGMANSKKVALMIWEYAFRSTPGSSERGDSCSLIFGTWKFSSAITGKRWQAGTVLTCSIHLAMWRDWRQCWVHSRTRWLALLGKIKPIKPNRSSHDCQVVDTSN